MVGVAYTVYAVGTVNKTTAKSINNECFAAVLLLKKFYYFFLLYGKFQGIWQ
jgi:hypothetical protein